MACATRIVVDPIFVTTNAKTSAARNVIPARNNVHRNVLTPNVLRNVVRFVTNAQNHVMSNASIVHVPNSAMKSVIDSLAMSNVKSSFLVDILV
jgi:hypothetical protein